MPLVKAESWKSSSHIVMAMCSEEKRSQRSLIGTFVLTLTCSIHVVVSVFFLASSPAGAKASAIAKLGPSLPVIAAWQSSKRSRQDSEEQQLRARKIAHRPFMDAVISEIRPVKGHQLAFGKRVPTRLGRSVSSSQSSCLEQPRQFFVHDALATEHEAELLVGASNSSLALVAKNLTFGDIRDFRLLVRTTDIFVVRSSNGGKSFAREVADVNNFFFCLRMCSWNRGREIGSAEKQATVEDTGLLTNTGIDKNCARVVNNVFPRAKSKCCESSKGSACRC